MNKALAFTFPRKYIGLAIILSCGLVSLSILIPLKERVDHARYELKMVRQELAERREAIWRLGEMDQEALETELTQLKRRYLADENLTLLIEDITELAQDQGLSVKSISPQEKTTFLDEESILSPLLDRIPVEVKLQGSFKSVSEFLQSLSELQSGIIRVRSYNLSRSSLSDESLDLGLTADIFVKKESIEILFSSDVSYEEIKKQPKAESRFHGLEGNPFFTRRRVARKALTVEGVIYDPQSPMVLVGGEVKRVGESVGFAQILEITRNSALFKEGDREFRVNLDSD